jgi:hypothetical protein
LQNIAFDIKDPEAPHDPALEGRLVNENNLPVAPARNPDLMRAEVVKLRGQAERNRIMMNMEI